MRDTADVVDAVRFGRSEGLEISVRGGGHNVAGRAVTDVAIITDIHANLPALQAALAHIDRLGIEEIYCGVVRVSGDGLHGS